MSDDPDETEGHKIYRMRANRLAAIQMNIAKRKVRLESRPPKNLKGGNIVGLQRR